MHSVEQVLRRLALNDERSIALLTVGAATVSLRCDVERAHAAGITEEEIVGVLFSIAPAVGPARVVAGATRLALARGYDVEED